MSRHRKVSLDHGRVVRIVGDGMIAVRDAYAGTGIPVLIVDSTAVPEIAEAIRVSSFEPNGDVQSQWGQSETGVLLAVELLRPVPTDFLIFFDLTKQGILVETALAARMIQIKAGESESTFKSTFHNPGLLIEVPGRDGLPPWPAIFIRTIMEGYRREGVKTAEARTKAEAAYEAMLTMARFQLPPGQAD